MCTPGAYRRGTAPIGAHGALRAVTDDRPPRVAYLVLSHKNPGQVEALADRILELSPAGEVVVHHDAAAVDVPWNGSPPARIHLVERMRVLWGDWSLVEASLRLLRFAADTLDAEWFVFASGDDRPVRDLAAWEREVASSGADGLVPARELVSRPAFGRRPTADDLNYVRYAHRWRVLPRIGRGVLELARRISRYVQPLCKIEYSDRRDRWFLGVRRRRRLPAGWALYAGSQWMAFDRRAAEILLSVDGSVTAWFRHTWIPDQGYFQTVLGNQDSLRLRDDLLTYVVPHSAVKRADWMVLRAEDLDAIRRSGAAFARKFDPAVDPAVLPAIDASIDAARHAPPGRP
jgi:hypothetical protein